MRAKTKDEVLKIFGNAFGYTEEKYWGKNWDAFKDILGYLNSGGIYGTNMIIREPITLVIENYYDYKYESPEDFAILVSIINDESKNSGFRYKFVD